MTDQQRFDQTGYASDGHIDMPILDALAKRGTVFDTAYSASTTCVPARVALLTGIQPNRTPTQENHYALAEGFWTVARELRAAGYETAAIGKMHFAPVHADHGFNVLRTCEHLLGQGLGPISKARGDVTDDYNHWLLAQGFEDWRFGERTNRRVYPLPAETHPTSWVERETLEFLQRRDRSKPLFLIVSFLHPHGPYNPVEPYASAYDPATERLPISTYEANQDLPKILQWLIERSADKNGPVTERSLRKFLSLVRGMLRHIDDAMGRVIDELDLDQTGVFFTSDHGDYSGHRGLWRKSPWLPFDDLARVPLVAAGLDIAPGNRLASLVQSCDLPQTWLDYAGIDPPEELPFTGRSSARCSSARTLRPTAIGSCSPASRSDGPWSAGVTTSS